MKKVIKFALNWNVIFGSMLLLLSGAIYYSHYMIFHDAHHIFVYGLGELAFLPIEVLLVTMIIHNLLEIKEKRSRHNKMNMAIGVFFSEFGSRLIKDISSKDPQIDGFKSDMNIVDFWDNRNFKKIKTCVSSHDYSVAMTRDEVVSLRDWLVEKRSFMLSLLENPSLLEHEAFTDLLWAIFHLIEELQHREQIGKCSDTDLDHIKGDINRVYCQITVEWIKYMKHLQKAYPYLFSLALRTNPFNASAKVEID